MSDSHDERNTNIANELLGRYSKRLADLFAWQANLPQIARRTPQDVEQAVNVAREIKQIMSDMRELRDQQNLWHDRRIGLTPEEKTCLQQAESEVLRIRRELCRVADSQTRLKTEWSAAQLEHPDFLARHRELAKDYRILLDELDRAREFLASLRKD